MAKKPDTELLRSLPQIEEVLQQDSIAQLEDVFPHDILADAARATVDAARQKILAGQAPDIEITAVAQQTAARVLALTTPSLRRVINASGVIIHTNLGRSVLAPEAIAAVDEVIAGYSTLEYSTQTMGRGSRHAHCERLICAITGAQAAIAVNNNAAAVLMVLSEFASGHEAIVSRGELVEIGGSFRIPDIMQLSHARMVEVGATNKTHVSDYERALSPETAMLLKVHPSNYRMIGFTENVAIDDLRKLADTVNEKREDDDRMLVYEDQGSGAFVRLDCFGQYAEPTVAESIRRGADLVSFSGDKLLGGPQAGIVVGSKELIDRLKDNPLARAMRLDKMTLAALEATLRLYLTPESVIERIPTLRMLSEDAEAVHVRAEQLRGMLADRLPKSYADIVVVPEISRAGGGALPMCDIPTFAVRVAFERGCAQECDEYLVRACPTPIIARVKSEHVLFDARTVLDDGEMEAIVDGVADYFAHI